MKKISLLKIIVALSICCAYIFTCGIMGVVRTSPATAPSASDVQTDAGEPVISQEASDAANGQGTVDFIVPEAAQTGAVHIDLMNFRQPSMADRVVFTSCNPISMEAVEGSDITEDDLLVISPEETEELIIIPDEAEEPERTAAATTTAATTAATTTAAATTTSATTTTPVTTTTKATTTTAATTTTKATTTGPNAGYEGGIRVDDEPEITTTAPEDHFTEEPDLPEYDSDAAEEILYVMNNGELMSGTAIDIVSGITQTEVGYTFAPEAIKAQAVAAYTYVKYYNLYGMYPNVIVSSAPADSVRVLVESVIGELIYYHGDIIQSVYSASSAGYTASSLNTWGNDYPYLISKYCELDEIYDPNYGRTASFSSDDVKARVYEETGIELTGDPSGWLAIEDYIEGNYVGQMNIGGYHSYTDSYGDVVKLTGRVFREWIMDFSIRSHAFDISYDAATDMFTFTTYGYGHGVGMSQNGAHALATYWGWDYKQILEFYYTGCEVY